MRKGEHKEKCTAWEGVLIFCPFSSLVQLTAGSDECQSPCKREERAVGGRQSLLSATAGKGWHSCISHPHPQILHPVLNPSSDHTSKALEILWLDSRYRLWLNQKATPVPLNRFCCWLQNPCKIFMFWVDLSAPVCCLSFPSFYCSDFKPHMI